MNISDIGSITKIQVIPSNNMLFLVKINKENIKLLLNKEQLMSFTSELEIINKELIFQIFEHNIGFIWSIKDKLIKPIKIKSDNKISPFDNINRNNTSITSNRFDFIRNAYKRGY